MCRQCACVGALMLWWCACYSAWSCPHLYACRLERYHAHTCKQYTLNPLVYACTLERNHSHTCTHAHLSAIIPPDLCAYTWARSCSHLCACKQKRDHAHTCTYTNSWLCPHVHVQVEHTHQCDYLHAYAHKRPIMPILVNRQAWSCPDVYIGISAIIHVYVDLTALARHMMVDMSLISLTWMDIRLRACSHTWMQI
jgi:hypothetical protein